MTRDFTERYFRTNIKLIFLGLAAAITFIEIRNSECGSTMDSDCKKNYILKSCNQFEDFARCFALAIHVQ